MASGTRSNSPTRSKKTIIVQKKDEEQVRRINAAVNEYKIVVLNPPRSGKKLVILDVDHILYDPAGFQKKLKNWMRPYLHRFLKAAYDDYDLAVWSATDKTSLRMKVDILDLENTKNFRMVFFLDGHAMTAMFTPSSIVRVKALKIIWERFPQYTPKNTLIVDHPEANFMANPKNGLILSAYKESDSATSDDPGLMNLGIYLKCIMNEPDFTALDHSKWQAVVSKQRSWMRTPMMIVTVPPANPTPSTCTAGPADTQVPKPAKKSPDPEKPGPSTLGATKGGPKSTKKTPDLEKPGPRTPADTKEGQKPKLKTPDPEKPGPMTSADTKEGQKPPNKAVAPEKPPGPNSPTNTKEGHVSSNKAAASEKPPGPNSPANTKEEQNSSNKAAAPEKPPGPNSPTNTQEGHISSNKAAAPEKPPGPNSPANTNEEENSSNKAAAPEKPLGPSSPANTKEEQNSSNKAVAPEKPPGPNPPANTKEGQNTSNNAVAPEKPPGPNPPANTKEGQIPTKERRLERPDPNSFEDMKGGPNATMMLPVSEKPDQSPKK